MRPPKYPLESALELRQRKVDDAARALAVAAGGREAAERHRLALQKTCEAHGDVSRQLRSAEREALARGGLSVADLSRAEAWEVRTAEEGRTLAGELSTAVTDEGDARAAERRAQDEFASRQAERQVVANHWARWRDGQRQRLEAREEEASSDAWRPRAGKPKP